MPQWLRSYFLLLRWQALTFRAVLPFVIVSQAFVGLGTVLGLGYFYPDVDSATAKQITTGASTLVLVTLGLVSIPQVIGQSKERGTFEYMWSLPIPRMAYLAADLTVWLLASLPGLVLALVVASLRYDFDLALSVYVIPAVLLVTLAAAFIGHLIGHISPSIVLTGVITNVIIFALYLFSPVVFPQERLPEALELLHDVLPVKYMTQLVQGTLTDGLVDGLATPFAVVGAWTAAGAALSFLVVNRRR